MWFFLAVLALLNMVVEVIAVVLRIALPVAGLLYFLAFALSYGPPY